MTGRAEATIAGLGLPYRIIEICTGDMGQSHHRSFDIECTRRAADTWLEVSSISWFSDYQVAARQHPLSGRRPERYADRSHAQRLRPRSSAHLGQREGGDPVAAATWFAGDGASWLHLVDLDGAFSGQPSPQLVARVAGATGLPVQAGGGYRTPEAIASALDAGAARVLVGTAALDPSFLAHVAPRFGEQLAVAVDVRDGLVAVEGWARASELTATELAGRCRDRRRATAPRHEHAARRLPRGA